MVIYRFHAVDHASAATASGLYEFGDWSGQLNSPHSGGNNPLIVWAELEPQEGVYNWSALDAAIAAARNAGKKVIPRIYTNVNDQEQGSPNWFFAAGGQYYYPSDGGPKSPVPWDSVYKAKFGVFLTALGARYNGNPTIEFFQTNAGGGAYAESWLGNLPPGYSPQLHIDTQKYWLDRWKAAFPSTALAIMVNQLGSNILESVSAYAAGKGVYLQTNQPWIEQSIVNVFKAQGPKTRIAMEVEDAGCQTSTVAKGFQGMIDTVFGYGFPIDYLTICGESFANSATAAVLPQVQARLRTHAPATTPAPSTPPPPSQTDTKPTPSPTSGTEASSPATAAATPASKPVIIPTPDSVTDLAPSSAATPVANLVPASSSGSATPTPPAAAGGRSSSQDRSCTSENSPRRGKRSACSTSDRQPIDRRRQSRTRIRRRLDA